MHRAFVLVRSEAVLCTRRYKEKLSRTDKSGYAVIFVIYAPLGYEKNLVEEMRVASDVSLLPEVAYYILCYKILIPLEHGYSFSVRQSKPSLPFVL